MKRNSLLSILIILVVLVFVYLVMRSITLDFRKDSTEVVYRRTSPETRISLFESKLKNLLESGGKILFRGGDVGFLQFSVSKDKHLIVMIPLSVSIPYAKPATWARFFMKTQHHKITLSAEEEARLREISGLRNAPVKVISKKKPSPERFIEKDLGTDIKRASEITEDVFIKVFQVESDYKVIHASADFRKIRW